MLKLLHSRIYPPATIVFISCLLKVAVSSSNANNPFNVVLAKNLSYYHEYWIKDAAQVYPMYLVTIEYDPIKEKLSRQVCRHADLVFHLFRFPNVTTVIKFRLVFIVKQMTPTSVRSVIRACTMPTRLPSVINVRH